MYVLGLDLLTCHAKFRGDTISRSRNCSPMFISQEATRIREGRKWRLNLLFLVVFRIFPNWNCHFRPWLWKAGCDVVTLYVLQSYRSCTFCKRKTRGETQFWIELAAPCTLANLNEIISDDTLPFIIFFTPFSCDGSNRFMRQRLLLSSCTLWRHKHTLFGVVRPLTGGKCRTFRRVIASIYLLPLHILRSGICIVFFRTEWPYRTKTVFILIALKQLTRIRHAATLISCV